MEVEEPLYPVATGNVSYWAAWRIVGVVVVSLALCQVAPAQISSRYAHGGYTAHTLPPPVPHLAVETEVQPHQTPGHGLPSDVAGNQPDLSLQWWEQDLVSSILRDRSPLAMTLPQALQTALAEAPELRVLQSDWMIQQQEVCRQDAVFDWTAFVDSIWNRDSNPVGSDLDGATERLRSRTLDSGVGVRRLTRDGTEVELSQGFGLYSSNSRFINPNYQGNSRLALQFRKPLLQGAGEVYNTAGTQLAQIDQETAYDRLQAGIQDYLLQVTAAYWNLVLYRGRFVQSVTAWNRAQSIVDEMRERVDIDVTPAMLERSQLAVTNRLALSIEAEFDVLRAQDALLRLVYGPRFTEFVDSEILTSTIPLTGQEMVQAEPQVQRALQSRSEIHEAIRRIRASSLRLEIARNEVQPVLDMVLTGYSAGLRGNNDVGGSLRDQFTEGEPGVGIGFNFEFPHHNRAARAGAEQARIAISRMQSEFETTIGMVTEDVRNQVYQRNKYSAMLKRYGEALFHARRNLEYTETRRHYLTDGPNVADLYLENLLQMQARLTTAEFTFLQSQISYSIANDALSRAVGVLPMAAVVDQPELPLHDAAQGQQPQEPLPTLQPVAWKQTQAATQPPTQTRIRPQPVAPVLTVPATVRQ